MVTEQNDQAAQAFSAKQAVVYFSAAWCQPCKQFFPVVKSLVKEFEDTELIKVDVDQNLAFAAHAKILAVPAMIFLKNGQQINGQKVGVQNVDELRDYMKGIFA